MSLLPPEFAHHLTIRLMAAGLGPRFQVGNPILATRVAGIEFPNPLGLAAGFDKNARAVDAALNLGFGFVEVGAVTPRPQPGNARPRVFRLRADQGVINRYGFNNDGLEKIAARLNARARHGIIGVNLGANKDTQGKTSDYVKGVRALAGLTDFFTVNISSPNTPGLRALQDGRALNHLLASVLEARREYAPRTPVFLKIAPDLTDADKTDICDAAKKQKLDGLIISNTTVARPASLRGRHAGQSGGLSGKPLFAPSTQLLGEFYKEVGGDIPLIGVGGIFSARDAYEKILNGASLIQLYTALIFEGPSLPAKILGELAGMLEADGFANVRDAAGAKFR